jgi:hypothetical protein
MEAADFPDQYSARIGKDVATTAAATIKLTLIARIAVSLL